LAEEQARDAAGSFNQWKNEVSDFAEIIGGPLKDAMAEHARAQTEFMRRFKSDFERYISDVQEGVDMVKKLDLTILTFYKNVYQYSPWGLLYKGYKKITQPEPISKPQPPKLGPLSESEISSMIMDRTKGWTEQLYKDIQAESKRRKEIEESVRTIREKYIPLIDKEIQITGRIGEAHYHAAKMVEYESAIKEAGLQKTKEGLILMDEMKQKLKELEKAQRLARIADDIGESFAGAFEDMIFEAKKLEDVMKSLFRSIARSIMQNLIFQPLGLQISGMISNMFPTGGSGGLPKVGKVTPQHGATVTRYQHGGLALSPHIGVVGEVPELITPLSKLGSLFGQRPPNVIINNNNTGVNLIQEEQPRFDGKNWVVNVVSEAIDQDMTFRRKIAGLR
jgi:hypothetical protein